MKCFVCKTGNLSVSGCHEYCDNCNFSRFVVTEDYIDSCVLVLASLCSNTKFNNETGLMSFIHMNIESHLPRLHDFMKTMTGDPYLFLKMIMDDTLSQAINVQLGDAKVNAVEKGRDLQCACGCTDFQPGEKYPLEVWCKYCMAKFIFNNELGIYEPEFVCECGYMAWDTVDKESGLSECMHCNAAYIHNATDNTFTRVTSDD